MILVDERPTNTIDFETIAPQSLESMMVQSGWNKIKTFPGIASVWRSSHSNCVQWVPLDRKYDDYAKLAKQAWLAAATDHCLEKLKSDETQSSPIEPDKLRELVGSEVKALLG